MQIYTVYFLNKSEKAYSLYVHVGWAHSEDDARSQFSDAFGMALAIDAKILPGVSPTSEAIKPIWSKTTANDIMAVGKDKTRYWTGSMHYGTH